MCDLPPDLLQRTLSNLSELCSLRTRGLLTCVCKTWAGAVQANQELLLSPDCLDGIGPLTQRQSQRFNNTLSNIKSLRSNCLLSSQVAQVFQLAEACPKLKVLEVCVDGNYGNFSKLDGAHFFGLLIDLLWPDSWAVRLHKLNLHTADMTLLTTVRISPIDGNFLHCITAGHINVLQLAFSPLQFLTDATDFECMPALHFLEVGISTLYEVGFTKTIRGTLNPKNLDTFVTTCEVHCTGWSGPYHLQKTLLSSVKPFSTIKAWVAESAQCAALICRVAPNLQVLKVNDLYISEGTIAHVNLLDSLQSVDLACSQPSCHMHVEGCPGKGLRHLRLESFNIVLTQQVAQWLADV